MAFDPKASKAELITSRSTLKEGEVLTTTVNTKNVRPGTTLFWTLSGEGINSADFSKGALSGSNLVDATGSFSFSHALSADIVKEGTERLNIALYSDKSLANAVAKTSVSITDKTRAIPTYSLRPSKTSLTEGDDLTTTIDTKNVRPGTTLFWTLSGEGINSADFSKGALSGSNLVDATGSFSFSHALSADIVKEGTERLNIALYSDKSLANAVAKTSVSITDKTRAIPTYSLRPSKTSLTEGDDLTTTIDTKNVRPGTTLFWTLSGEGINSADFSKGALSGSNLVDATGSFSFSHALSADIVKEGTERLNIALYSDKSLANAVAKTSVSITDKTSAIPTYSLRPSKTSLTEGDVLTTTIDTKNVRPGTTLFWTLSGEGINSADFSKGALSGSNLVDATGSFSFSHALSADIVKEGTERLNIALYSDKSLANAVAKTSVSITDKTRAIPTYSLRPSKTSLTEGDDLTTTIDTKNVRPGTTLFWTLSGEGINSADFSKGALSGSNLVDATGSFSFSHALSADIVKEGTERLNIALYSDKSLANAVAKTSVSITDKTRAIPTYSLRPSKTSLTEGDDLTTTIDTKNVRPGTTLFWTLSGEGINSADFSKGALSGSNLVDATGSFSFSHALSADIVKEGTERLNIALYSDKSLANAVAKTSVSITDSAQQPAPVLRFNQKQTPKTITEGDTLILRGSGKNLQPGTTLYWGLNKQTSDATIKDFKEFAPKRQEGFTTTIDNKGKFEITLASLRDQINEESELFQIDLYLSQATDTSLATSEPINLIDSKQENNIEIDIELESHVIPARFANEAIPVQKLINFSDQDKKVTFNFNNSNTGGYFEYQKTKYQGTEILDVPATKLSQLYYVPTAPKGHYDTSKLRTITTETPTETFKPKGGGSKFVKQESLGMVQQRQNPFNPLTSIGTKSNPSIRDQISVSVNTPDGRSQPARAEWITRGNWQPEITVLQNEFTAQRAANAAISITDILNIHDIDGDKIKNIQINDMSNAKQSGYFEYKKEIYQGRNLPVLNETDFARVNYHPGQGGLNTIEISASDELNGQSQVIKVQLQTKEAPKASLANTRQTFDSADIGKPIPLKNLINISTTEADDTNTYKLDLKSKGKKDEALGYFSLLGKRLKPEQLTGLNQETVRDIQFVPTNNKIRSNFTLEATDQSGKTITSSTAWKTTKNQKPTLTVEPVQFDSSQANKPVAISHLIDAEDDSDSITSYTLKSVKGKGSFRFNGKTYSNQTLTVGAEDLELVSYLAPGLGQNDRIKVTASDGDEESQPAFMNLSTVSIMEPGSVSQSFNIGVDKEWKIGDFLGVQNEQTYSKFFGMDKTISNRNFNAGIGIAGVKFKTGNTEMKAGLQLDAGYGLGSLSLQGGLSASATLDENGLTFEGTSSDPTLDFELPYAYLGLDAVGEFKFAPSLKFWYDIWLADGQTSNLLSFLNTNVNVSNSLIDLDTRHITGSNYTRSFNIGAFSANASLPNFGNVSELNRIPTTFQSDSTWSNGHGDGIAYGVSGSTTLLDLSLSLGQVASYFGLPLSINKSIWGGDLSITGTLADASIGIDAELNYGAKVAVKPNVYAQVEGLRPLKKHDILGGDTSLDFSSFRDTDNDGNISVTIEADPIIAANASVSIEGGVTAAAEVLSARARVNKWTINKTWNVGPLWEGGPWDLYSNEVSLIDMTRSYKLSDLAPSLQDQLSVTLELPVI